MLDYLKMFWSLKHDRRAVTALEYALIAGLLAVVLVVAVTSLGTNLTNTFAKIGSDVTA